VIEQEHPDVLAKYLGLQGFEVWDVDVEEAPRRRDPRRRVMVIRLRDLRGHHHCGGCGKRHGEGVFQESEPVRFREVSRGDLETYVEIHPWRVRCCGGTRRERFPFEAEGHQMTRSFFYRVAALCTRLPIEKVAVMAKLSWATVAKLDMEATQQVLTVNDVEGLRLRWIGVDEVSRTGGRVYFTIVTDLESGKVVWIGDRRGEEGLVPFLRKLGKKGRNRIRGVVSDLGYVGVIDRYLPGAIHLLDRFHIVKWMNEALNEVRRAVYGRAPKEGAGKLLKAKKWMLLAARETLRHEDKLLLHRLVSLNQPLYEAYLLKEQLRELLQYRWRYWGALKRRLAEWIEAARGTGLGPLDQVASRLEKHVDRIVAGFQHQVPMGLVESINRKIVGLRYEARGYRNPEYHKLKIFQRCNLVDNPWARITL
jgi:transposase